MLAALFLLPATSLSAQTIDELEAQDLRLAGIADNILLANARLCRTRMPVSGLILHSRDQYGDLVSEERFASGDYAIAQVLPGSAAAGAGLQRDDAILAINGTAVDSLEPQGATHLREVAFDILADAAMNGPLSLTIARGGERFEVALDAPSACRALVEVRLGEGARARTDGRIMQLTYVYMTLLSDDEVAIAVAHELAHIVLEHRRRKTEAGIDNGSIFRSFGRNQQINRAAEIEADRLSVHLLANAGYDPAIAEQFWRSEVGASSSALSIPSFVYPSREDRADLIAREVAMFLPLRRGPSWPGHLLQLRNRPFSDY
ncbi:Putative Zn-dependent protease, contains TPR repeats [Aurantiacibacter gangjinensis]|nr:Putative Zn-dependent protease, contains TPR repeats [Aurantiacibacter gangjinensis]